MARSLRISRERLIRDLEELGEIGSSPGAGRTRLALSPEDFEAREFLIERMKRAGLEVRTDQVGNIIGRREGKKEDAPIVAFGSHIDTVPNAGMFDGCLGVLSALEVIRTLNDAGITTLHPLEVVSFSNEEGVRFPLMTGSKVAAGVITVEDAYQQRDQDGVSYREALEKGGLSIDSLSPARRKKGEVKAWIELHIEQGPVLYSEGVKIGIVEAIAGLLHLIATIKGVPGHAGTTPMHYRKDPLIAAAQAVLEVNRVAKETGERTVGTVGMLRVQPGAINVIPAQVEMSIDFRDIDAGRIASGTSLIRRYLEETCGRMGLELAITERARLDPTPMSKTVIESIRRSAEALGVSYRLMPSGAAHDTQNMARICDVGMIFVPSKDGISHSPLEWTDYDDASIGANVLLQTVIDLAGG